MWGPVNKDALPSTEEIQCAKGAIGELEIMLKDAVELVEQAKTRVVALTKDLDERKAWIAPIRKVPVEILSEIFISTSQVDDLSPVTITEVCCFWRKVILSTPRAWSLIYADRLKNNTGFGGEDAKTDGLPPQYFLTFIQRSNPCMLHISMPRGQYNFEEELDGDDVLLPARKALTSSIQRVHCLSIRSGQIFRLESEVLPNLTKLTLLPGEYEVTPSFFKRSRFPCLQYLDCTNYSLESSLEPGTTFFPPIQHLAVNIEYGGWIELVQGCADTLVGLYVLEHDGAERIPAAAISFPKLNSLAFHTRSNVTTDLLWPIQATTPSLQSYEQMRQDGLQQAIFHHDIKNVTHVCTDQLMELEEFVALRVLQFELHGHQSPLHVIRTTLHRLKENKDTCPTLQTVQISLSEEDFGDSFKLLIPGFENTVRRGRPDVTLCFTDDLFSLSPLPGSVEQAECGPGMPCFTSREPL